MKTCKQLLLSLSILLLVAGIVSAQPPFAGQSNSPTLSPYLNLSGFGGAGILNYFTLVQPQLQQQNQINQQQAQIQQLQRGGSGGNRPVTSNVRGNPLNNAPIRGTGHASGYFNYSHYYQLQQQQRR
jgi:hypothetical protein